MKETSTDNNGINLTRNKPGVFFAEVVARAGYASRYESKLKRNIEMKIRILFLSLVLLALFGCGQSRTESEPEVCLPVVALTAVIEVFDGRTGLPIACGTTVTLSTDGQVLWTQVGPFPPAETCDDKAAFSPFIGSGTYTIIVSKPGYNDWQKTITVNSLDQCGYTTDAPELKIHLNRTSSE